MARTHPCSSSSSLMRFPATRCGLTLPSPRRQACEDRRANQRGTLGPPLLRINNVLIDAERSEAPTGYRNDRFVRKEAGTSLRSLLRQAPTVGQDMSWILNSNFVLVLI